MIISIDFDGTLCSGAWPDIENAKQKPIHKLVAMYARYRVKKGDILVLNTMREDRPHKNRDYLTEACHWCDLHTGLVFSDVNENSDAMTAQYGYSRKVYADIYIDDHNAGLLGWILRRFDRG